MITSIKQLAGYYNLSGAWDEPDKRDLLATSVPTNLLEFPSGLIDMAVTPVKDQKRTNRCVAFAITTVVEQMLTNRLKKLITIDPRQIWDELLKRGATESRGAMLQWAVKAIVEKGLVFNSYDLKTGAPCMQQVRFKGYAITRNVAETEDYISKGHPIFTGSKVYDNAITTKKYWDLEGKEQGAHAFVLNRVHKPLFSQQNSWGEKWGMKGFSYIDQKDIDKLFSKYILFGMEIN